MIEGPAFPENPPIGVFRELVVINNIRHQRPKLLLEVEGSSDPLIHQ